MPKKQLTQVTGPTRNPPWVQLCWQDPTVLVLAPTEHGCSWQSLREVKPIIAEERDMDWEEHIIAAVMPVALQNWKAGQ